MTLLRTLILGLAATAAVAAMAPAARADNWCVGPTSNQPKYSTFFGFAFASHQAPPQPVFQAAPWYLYWPYDGHFLTPAPIGGAFYGPPVPGNMPVNPYFPQPNVPFGAMPGGQPAGMPAPIR